MASSLLLPLLLLLLVVHGHQAEQVCVSGKKVTLSLDYTTNSTGHPKINARLEQPMESAGWQLDVEMGTSACGPGGVQRKTLALTLNGSPPQGSVDSDDEFEEPPKHRPVRDAAGPGPLPRAGGGAGVGGGARAVPRGGRAAGGARVAISKQYDTTEAFKG